MALRTSELTLYDKPPTLCFSQSQLAELQHTLCRVDNSTTVLGIQGLGELSLREDGRTVIGGYRYTSVAFQQLTELLARGSLSLLQDLSGLRRRQEQAVSGQLARRVFNDVLALRLPSLRGYKLVRNEAGKVIDGLLGPRHYILENSSLLQQAQTAAATAGRGMVFYAGVCMGRRLLLWYREPRAATVTVAENKTWKLYPGYYFANGEVRGTAMRGTIALLSPRGCCLEPFGVCGVHISHYGRDFGHKLDKLFRMLCARQFPLAKLATGLKTLSQTPLGFGADPADLLNKRHKRRLVSLLGDLRVPTHLAKLVIEQAARTSIVHPESLLPPTLDVLAQRTALDLWGSLVTIARRLPLTRREGLEQAAWQLLQNGFQFER